MAAILQLRRGTSNASPILTEGELYLHQSSGSIQFGSGSNTYTLLPLSAPAYGNINLVGDISASSLTLTGNLTVAQNITFGGALITLGDSNTDNIVITADLSSSIIPNDNNAFDLGASNKKWKNLYAVSASIDSILLPGSGILSSSGISFDLYTASIDTKNSTLASYTSSVDTKFTAVGYSTSSLNSFTSSEETKNSTLATYTSSLETKNSTLATYTASIDTKNSTLGTYTASLDTKNSTLGTYTASIDTKNSTLGTYTSSLETKNSTLASYTSSVDTKFSTIGESTASLNYYTSSQDTKNSTLGTYTSSLETKNSTLATYTSSLETKNSTLAIWTSSIDTYITNHDTKNSTLATWTGSIDTKNSTLATYTSSNDTKWQTLQNVSASVLSYTSSLKQAIELTGSSVTILGNLVVNGTQTTINSTAIQLGDNIIELNGMSTTNAGIVVKDPTGANTETGSLIYNTTNDYWMAGQWGNESKILLAGGDNIVSSSAQVASLLPTGVVSGSSQVTASLDNRYLMIDGDSVVSSSAQIVHILTDLNSYTSSQDTKNSTLGTYTSSLETKNSTLATYTASVDSQLSNLNNATSSYETTGRGIVSGSSQITYSDISAIPAGIVSGSSQVTPLLPNGTISGSSQVVYTSLSSIPAGIVSGSSQIPSLLPSGVVSGSSQLTGSYDGRYAPSASFATLLGANTLASLGSAAFYYVTSSADIVLVSGSINYTNNHLLTAGATKKYVDWRTEELLAAAAIADILSVSAGDGLGGGGLSGDVTLTLDTASAHFKNGVDIRLTALNSYTSSQDTKNSTLATYTSSLETKNSTLATYTSSLDTKNSTLGTYTSSVDTLNTAQNNRLTSLETFTGSVPSLSSLNSYTSSQDTKNSTLSTYTASLETKNSTLANVTGSLLSSQTKLNSYTASLNAAIELTGSTVSFLGDIVVYGTQSIINSQNVQISDNILYLSPTASIDNDLGVVGHYNDGTYRHAGIFMDASDGHSWKVFNGLTSEAGAQIDTAGTGFTLADFKGGAFTGTSFNGVINATNGVISGSSQLTATLPSGVVSGSSQIILLLPSGVVSGSSQVTRTLQQITDTGASTSNAITISNATASTNKTTGALIVTGGIGVSGDINAGGDIVAFASSDIRLKNNIKPIENPLEKISKINGCEFDWNADLQTIYSGKDYGVIAQEIEEVFPELVQTRENGYKAVKYDKLVSVLIEGIKELTKQVEYLKTKIEN